MSLSTGCTGTIYVSYSILNRGPKTPQARAKHLHSPEEHVNLEVVGQFNQICASIVFAIFADVFTLM